MPAQEKRVVTLLTDFGIGIYAAAMKGVILQGAPGVQLVDISHNIAPQNVTEAAVVLSGVAPFYPQRTTHCAVVDPGVGTERRIVLVAAGEHFFIAPDNGLLTLVLRKLSPEGAWSVENEEYFCKPVSATFHGRDIFAPVAAAVAAGESPESFGPEIDPDDLEELDFPEPRVDANGIEGEVVFVDEFGNLVSNIESSGLQDFPDSDELEIHCAGHVLTRLATTYGEVPPGELVALTGSLGYLEVAVSRGSAAARLAAAEGERVLVRRAGYRPWAASRGAVGD